MTLSRSSLLIVEPRLKDVMKHLKNRSNVSNVQVIKKGTKQNRKKTKVDQIPSYISRTYDSFCSNKQPLSFDEQFDELAEDMLIMPTTVALEKSLKLFFKTDLVVIWLYEKEKNLFFSATYNKMVPCNVGLMGKVLSVQYNISAHVQNKDPNFSEANDGAIIQGDYNVVVLPIFSDNDTILYVAQISMGLDTEKQFEDAHISLARKLIDKFKIYGHLMFNEGTTMNLPATFNIAKRSAERVCTSMQKFFQCSNVYFVMYQPKIQQCVMITKDSGIDDKCIINPDCLGFITDGITKMETINVTDITKAKDYNPNIDGTNPVPALCISFQDNHDIRWVCVLKSPRNKPAFTFTDQYLLKSIVNFACRALSFIFTPQSPEEIDLFEARLKSLLEVAEILSGVLDIDTLLPTIMNHACKLLRAERCSLFLVDSAHNELTTRFHGGLSSAIRVKIGRGIVGSCAQTGEIVNIKDAYADPRFDRSVDLATGFTTRSLLCVAIHNNRGEITGVTEMINKQDDGLFDEDDIKMLLAFNVFCGISIDNARLYKASLDLTNQLRSFIKMSTALTTITTSDTILEEILHNIQSIVNASRVTLYLCDQFDNSLKERMNFGETQKYGAMFAQETVAHRKFKLFDHKDVIGRTQTQQLNAAIDRILAAGLDADILVFGEEEQIIQDDENINSSSQVGVPRIANIDPLGTPTYIQSSDDSESERNTFIGNDSRDPFDHYSNTQIPVNKSEGSDTEGNDGIKPVDDSSDDEDSSKLSEVICCLPMLSSEAAVLGVIELSCNWKILSEDIKLLECFSIFAALSIERSRLKDKASLGETFYEMKNWISEKELKQTSSIPKKLVISMEKLSVTLMLKFNAPDWDGIGLFKVVFAIFDIFDICKTFNISNERLFCFLTGLRNGYKKVPYHNWRHAVDVMQFVAYQILAGALDTVFTKFEILAILVSALCHDIGHDGFSDSYHDNAQTPLNLLFKNQSVMEILHCSISISILSKEECNIFQNLSSNDYKSMWNTIITLVLSTDMGKHFEILNEAVVCTNGGSFNLEIKENRFLLMKVLIKCGDLCNISRPFEIANKWGEEICEEFFMQGDLDKVENIYYTSHMVDRAHIDRSKSRIGFYTSVCLPIFQIVTKMVPKLSGNYDQVQSNVNQWFADSNQPKEQNKK